eukprot:COSAG02_NODE_3999_length_5933_cov_3.627871_2_plen_73_part_00
MNDNVATFHLRTACAPILKMGLQPGTWLKTLQFTFLSDTSTPTAGHPASKHSPAAGARLRNLYSTTVLFEYM